MNKLSVDKCIDVLNVFCACPNEELWVNKIVKKVNETTGSKDFPAIKKSIKLLEKAEILKSEKKGKQQSNKILTPLGEDIIDFIITLDSVHKIFNNFLQEVKKSIKFVYDEDKVRINKLKDLKWNEVDIQHFDELMNTFHFSIEFYAKNIFNLLIYRYLSFVIDQKVNSIVKSILLKIITAELIKQSEILEGTESVEMFKDYPLEEGTDICPFIHQNHYAKYYLCSTFFVQLNKLYTSNYYPVNLKFKNLLEELYISMIQLTSEDKYIDELIVTKHNKIFRSDHLYIYQLSTTIAESNDVKDQGDNRIKSFDEKFTMLGNLYQKTINKRRFTKVIKQTYPTTKQQSQ